MILSNLYLNCEDAFSYPGKPSPPPVDRMQLGTGATYRLYETGPIDDDVVRQPYENPDPRWVFLSATADQDFRRFGEVAGRPELATDFRFASVTARAEHRSELETVLAEVFKERSALEWEKALLDAGVGCVVADAMSHFAFLYRDSQAQARGLVVPTEHPSLGGKYWRYAPVIRFSDTPGQALPYCEKGEHTRAILAGVGFDEDEIDRLKDEGVVTWPAPDLAAAR
jgi:crotonobetainyl-CoA:carnitine CoA-transferase CaiB-like acyl-CoA transferase